MYIVMYYLHGNWRCQCKTYKTEKEAVDAAEEAFKHQLNTVHWEVLFVEPGV